VPYPYLVVGSCDSYTKFVPSEGSGIFTRVCTLDDLFQVVVGEHLQMEKTNEML
jgi:hypothetical protein